jgi:hypothetical protein
MSLILIIPQMSGSVLPTNVHQRVVNGTFSDITRLRPTLQTYWKCRSATASTAFVQIEGSQ